jgi:hypothetical protein
MAQIAKDTCLGRARAGHQALRAGGVGDVRAGGGACRSACRETFVLLRSRRPLVQIQRSPDPVEQEPAAQDVCLFPIFTIGDFCPARIQQNRLDGTRTDSVALPVSHHHEQAPPALTPMLWASEVWIASSLSALGRPYGAGSAARSAGSSPTRSSTWPRAGPQSHPASITAAPPPASSRIMTGSNPRRRRTTPRS